MIFKVPGRTGRPREIGDRAAQPSYWLLTGDYVEDPGREWHELYEPYSEPDGKKNDGEGGRLKGRCVGDVVV